MNPATKPERTLRERADTRRPRREVGRRRAQRQRATGPRRKGRSARPRSAVAEGGAGSRTVGSVALSTSLIRRSPPSTATQASRSQYPQAAILRASRETTGPAAQPEERP